MPIHECFGRSRGRPLSDQTGSLANKSVATCLLLRGIQTSIMRHLKLISALARQMHHHDGACRDASRSRCKRLFNFAQCED